MKSSKWFTGLICGEVINVIRKIKFLCVNYRLCHSLCVSNVFFAPLLNDFQRIKCRLCENDMKIPVVAFVCDWVIKNKMSS